MHRIGSSADDDHAIAFLVNDLHVVSQCPDGLNGLANLMSRTMGPDVKGVARDALDNMRAQGQQVLQDYFSFLRKPFGVASAVLYETYVLMKEKKILSKPLRKLERAFPRDISEIAGRELGRASEF